MKIASTRPLMSPRLGMAAALLATLLSFAAQAQMKVGVIASW